MLYGFDPVNIMEDRRILYEVTGMRLRSGEFRDDSSSDSELDEASEELLLIDYAFMDRYASEVDTTGQRGINSYTLNP